MHDFDRARQLIAAGGDVDYSEWPDHETALMALSSSPDSSAVEFLIHAKADLERRSSKGLTAVMYAAMNGQVDNIRLLAAAGADVNAVTTEGVTAVSIAKAGNHRAAVDVLLALGASDVAAKAIP